MSSVVPVDTDIDFARPVKAATALTSRLRIRIANKRFSREDVLHFTNAVVDAINQAHTTGLAKQFGTQLADITEAVGTPVTKSPDNAPTPFRSRVVSHATVKPSGHER